METKIIKHSLSDLSLIFRKIAANNELVNLQNALYHSSGKSTVHHKVKQTKQK